VIHARGRVVALAAMACMAAAGRATAEGDWPQLWGPTVSASAEVANDASGLKELWRRPIGSGFSSIAVVGGRGYTGESDGSTDQVIAFDLGTGKTLWRAALGETYRGHDGSRDGPIATPAVGGGRVFMLGPRGLLVALDAASGRELWRRDLATGAQVKAPSYGFGGSPVLAGDRVVLQVGGAEKSGLVAFEAASGTPAWTALLSDSRGDSAGYTMAAPATLGGERQLVVTAHDRVFAVRAEDGALAWSHTLPEAEEPIRAPLVLPGDRLLVSRESGSTLLTLAREAGAWKAAVAWQTPRLKGGLSPTVHDNGALYGISGQYLICLDLATGAERWRWKTFAGSLIRVGRTLVVLGAESGVLRLVAAGPEAYKEIARTSAFSAGALSATGPSYADRRIYVRNVEEMVAFALQEAPVTEARP
jgi:outer membrane protein assembly factor BamB